jgi:hypothetical protein
MRFPPRCPEKGVSNRVSSRVILHMAPFRGSNPRTDLQGMPSADPILGFPYMDSPPGGPIQDIHPGGQIQWAPSGVNVHGVHKVVTLNGSPTRCPIWASLQLASMRLPKGETTRNFQGDPLYGVPHSGSNLGGPLPPSPLQGPRHVVTSRGP